MTYLADGREHSFVAFAISSLLLALLDICCKIVEQVIDDFGSENLNFVFFGKLHSIWHDFDVKDEHAGEFFVNSCSSGH